MKNRFLLIITILFSFIVFSCASSATPETETEIQEPVVTEETVETEAKEEILEQTEDTKDSIDGTNKDSDKEELEKIEELEEIEEPLVRDLIISVEEEEECEDITPSEEEQKETEPEEELVTDIDELPVIEFPEEENEFSEEDAYYNDQEETSFDDEEITDSEENDEESDETDNSESENIESENVESEDTESEEAEEEQEIEEEVVIVPSRSVTLKKGENLEVLYPGSGWVYMGSLSEYNNMASKGRKLGATDTKYTLLAKEAGTQIHHFYKVDNLTGEYIDDFLEVVILDKKGNPKTFVQAPAYVEVVPQKPEVPAVASEDEIESEVSETEEMKIDEPVVPGETEKKPAPAKNTEKPTAQNTKKPVSTGTTKSYEQKVDPTETGSKKDVIETFDKENYIESNNSKSADELIDVIDDSAIDVDYVEDISIDEDYSSNALSSVNTNDLLDAAQALYLEEKYSEANDLLVDFFEYAFDRIDEALYLQGQILEADSEIKDIKASIQSYEALIKNYPSSVYWNDSNKRIKYLRKFYYISN